MKKKLFKCETNIKFVMAGEDEDDLFWDQKIQKETIKLIKDSMKGYFHVVWSAIELEHPDQLSNDWMDWEDAYPLNTKSKKTVLEWLADGDLVEIITEKLGLNERQHEDLKELLGETQ